MGGRLRDGGHFTLIIPGPAVPDDAAARIRFIQAETRLSPVPHVPEIRLWQADDATLLWQRSEDELGVIGAALPFWAFAWAGGRGLARHVLDRPELVRGRRVLDFASGSGLVGIAAALADASSVTAADIDPFAMAAITLNAAANRVAVTPLMADLVGAGVEADVVLCGDIFYDRAMTATVLPWLRRLAASGITVVVGDPGRSYRPEGGVALRATITVPVEAALEDSASKAVAILTILPA
ncbi:50S ribosomal protein L11 methyltransferase [Mesorhizobium sp. BR1-1-16]|uniref:class I SAM-dependent methyltransferase n=1 Tax=Mesorhizobium sp. BR1-1-16 TaxID=2876653 RepID=UPI001CCC9973|nr:50S ribosomal protein L11 methyltransferase [Mesorhizobium sp. BR1-1-16]MBZ9937457.1 50S ribosomal protein L11 methyltransferase [Mesorhizobium sp. BR1-1-16]